MKTVFFLLLTTLWSGLWSSALHAQPEFWERQWPHTNFEKTAVNFTEIIPGGPSKGGIPAIDNPSFKPVSVIEHLSDKEPVIALQLNGEAKAYPLRVLIWHEIVNDQIGGRFVTVTYCPLCNSSVVFDRTVNGRVLDFGVSGLLRHSDMIMYDRQTESWWQQFVGRAIVGDHTGATLERLPSKVMPFAAFRRQYPDGQILVPPEINARQYGKNPYVEYDSARQPFLYTGRYNGPGKPLSYIVSVGKDAWLLNDLKKVGLVNHGDLRLEWKQGMNSALDSARINEGRDIGYVQVQRKGPDGYTDIAYDTSFAFAFRAFHPDGAIHAARR